MPGVLLIPINLNEIIFETNCLKMIVENKLHMEEDSWIIKILYQCVNLR